MQQLKEELETRGRMAIVEGECKRLEKLEPAPRSFNADDFLRVKGARALTPRQMQALRQLFILRDELARSRDVPPFKVLGNGALVAIARDRAPQSVLGSTWMQCNTRKQAAAVTCNAQSAPMSSRI